MSKKTETAWDSIPKEDRKKTIIVGVVMAVLGVIVGMCIALGGIFNPMNNIVTDEEPIPEIDITTVVDWKLPENASNAETKTYYSSIASNRIYFKDKKQCIDMYCMRYQDGSEDIEGLTEEKQADGSSIYWNLEDDEAYMVSPDKSKIIEVHITDDSMNGVAMTEEEYDKWSEEKQELLKEFIPNISWK